MKKQITDATQFWEWIENIFLPAAFVDDWYNGHEERVSEYIGNKRSILVGMPRLRQLRVKESKYIIYKKEFILLEFVADICSQPISLVLIITTTSENSIFGKVMTKLNEYRIQTHQNLNDF